MRHDPLPSPDTPDAALELLDRERLIQRWRCGSDSFFWRMEKKGLLPPLRCDGLLRYTWDDVLAFEGGLPPAGLEVEYRQDLLTPATVAAFCDCCEAKILDEAKSGRLVVRRIGRTARFVPAEVLRWQQTRWQRPNRRRWEPK
jgi:hypothetical protein